MLHLSKNQALVS